MECIKCGKYYPDKEKRCPWCNHEGSMAKRPEKMVVVAANLLRVDYERSAFKGFVGYLLFGAVGCLIGIKAKKKATFSVRYATGHTGLETVVVDSFRYRKLMSLGDVKRGIR